ncbi:MAG: DUF3828 domain-containing protein [Candidatus Omnitrophica bacterium]|nr:DUF3828 domain-containing protein [Candidatus Omnitrophota bacterium]
MKKNLLIIVSLYLFIMFLVYSGLFIKKTDPIAVTRCYFKYLKTAEYFLTYQIYNRETFDQERIYRDILKYDLTSMDKLDVKPIEIGNNYALIAVKIIYKNNKFISSILELKKDNNKWLITNVSYK